MDRQHNIISIINYKYYVEYFKNYLFILEYYKTGSTTILDQQPNAFGK